MLGLTQPSRCLEISSAEAAFRKLRALRQSEVEEFWVLALGPRKTLISSRMIFRGTVDSCLVHLRDVFRYACEENASAILVAHNHPSGDTNASAEDILFTRRLIEAGRLLDIPVVDHLIVTSDRYASVMNVISFDRRLR